MATTEKTEEPEQEEIEKAPSEKAEEMDTEKDSDEPAAKKPKTAEPEKPTEPEKPKYRFDSELALAFSFFDDSFNGLFKRSDLEEILMYGNLGLTKQAITDIVVFATKHCHASHRGELCYSKLISEIPIDFEWENKPLLVKRLATVDAKSLCSVSDVSLRSRIDNLTTVKEELVSKLNASNNDVKKSQQTIADNEAKIEKLNASLETKSKSLLIVTAKKSNLRKKIKFFCHIFSIRKSG